MDLALDSHRYRHSILVENIDLRILHRCSDGRSWHRLRDTYIAAIDGTFRRAVDIIKCPVFTFGQLTPELSVNRFSTYQYDVRIDRASSEKARSDPTRKLRWCAINSIYELLLHVLQHGMRISSYPLRNEHYSSSRE